MTPWLAPPTDSRRKFLAIFGLTLIIAAMFGWLTATNTLLDKKAALTEKIMIEEATPATTQLAVGRLGLHQQLLDAVSGDLQSTWVAAFVVLITGISTSLRGFRGWKTELEAREDRFAVLQESKGKAEVRKLELEAVALESKLTGELRKLQLEILSLEATIASKTPQ